MKIISRTQAVFIALVAGFSGLSGAALAESDPMARHQTRIDTGVRFPGDVAFKEGTIRTSGPEKGAYIERCTWGFKPDTSKGFGLTQTCIRYTMENTK